MSTRSSRGDYAKGIEARAAIIDSALELYATERRRPTLKKIALAAGLSEAGVLHYFRTVDELFIAVLQQRDLKALAEYNLTTIDEVFAYLESITKEVGLTELYVEMSIHAQNPAHPAAQFVAEHRRSAIELIAAFLDTPDVYRDARILVSAAEGLQLVWLVDRSVSISGDLRSLYDTLVSV